MVACSRSACGRASIKSPYTAPGDAGGGHEAHHMHECVKDGYCGHLHVLIGCAGCLFVPCLANVLSCYVSTSKEAVAAEAVSHGPCTSLEKAQNEERKNEHE